MVININHAFDGFLYSPLFLAEKLGFFPKCAKLEFRRGDSECLDALCKHKHNGEKNWFAICDPFSVPDISTKVPEQTEDNICIVGCLINKLPIWVYNPDTSVVQVGKEEDLSRYKTNIKKLICYKEGTTGHLIGKRLHRQFFSDSNLETKEFGQEFTTPIENDVAVVTSDILHIVHSGLNDQKIIFNYPTRSPNELRPFLFTGILTLKNEVLDENLWAVLTVLAGIKHATDLLSRPEVPHECIDVLVTQFQPQLSAMGVTNTEQKEALIKDSIAYAFHSWKLYSETLKPEKGAWDNAKSEWEKSKGQQFADTEERNEPIPSLLIMKNWRHDAELRSHFNKGRINALSALQSDQLDWYHKWSPVAFLLLGLLSLTTLLLRCHSATNLTNDWPLVSTAFVALIAQIIFTGLLFQDLLHLEKKRYQIYCSTAFASGFVTVIAAVGGIR